MPMLLAEASRAVQRTLWPCARRWTALDARYSAYARPRGPRGDAGGAARPTGWGAHPVRRAPGVPARGLYRGRPRARRDPGGLGARRAAVPSGLRPLQGGIRALNTAAAELHLLMSGFGDMAQTRAILYRGWAGDWYLTGRDVAGDHVPQPYPDPPPAVHRGTHTGFEPPPI